MKRLIHAISALLISLSLSVPALADVLDLPPEPPEPQGLSTPIVLVIAVVVIALAVLVWNIRSRKRR